MNTDPPPPTVRLVTSLLLRAHRTYTPGVSLFISTLCSLSVLTEGWFQCRLGEGAGGGSKLPNSILSLT
jgi:hypothetical protein